MSSVSAVIVGLIVCSPFIYHLITDLIDDYKKPSDKENDDDL